jgi:diguanylate cyclase (GGDEF)-like protein/PAS domain S-box-containing protein
VLLLIVVWNMRLHNEINQRKKMALALQKSETRYHQLFDSSVSGCALHEIICDNNGEPIDYRFLEVNSAFLEITGFKAEFIIGHSLLEVYPESEPFWIERYGQVALTGEADHFIEYSHIIKKYFEITAYSPQQGQFAVTFQDVTERTRAESELRIAATVFESQEGMMITDIQGVIVKVNQAFTLITGYSKDEVLNKTPRILRSGRHDKHFYQQLWQTINDTGSWQGEIWNRRKNGEVYPQWLTITAVKSNDNEIISHYVATLIDITERKITEERINQLAFYDPLTQLPNRRLLHERLKHGIEVSHRTGNLMAVLMLDLDKFKAVNDTFGHVAGDVLLQQVAERIKVHLREMDTIARLGGDEFIVLLENITQHGQVDHVANTIIHTLKQPFSLNKNHEAYIGTSIGIALYPQHGNDIETLIDNADTALYRAKDNGRSCFAYFSDSAKA